MIFENLKALSSYGEIIAGSKSEEKIKNKIKEILEESVDEIRIIPIRVLYWNQKDLLIECNGNKIEGVALPYSLPFDIEAKITDKIDNCNNKFIKIKLQKLYEIDKYYIQAVEHDCLGVIFSLDNEIRKYIIKYGELLSYKPSYPPPIPAFYVKLDDFSKIHEKCRILLQSEINPYAVGYIIEGIKNSKNENKKIHVTAHHDHWFKGERQSLLPVSLLPELRSNIYEIHLISFTAENSGAPSFSTFSWSYGSRTFLQKNINNDQIFININIDKISEENIIIKTVPGLSQIVKTIYRNISIEPEIFTANYSYIKNGIPSINIGSIKNPHCHSNYDEISNENSKAIVNAKEIGNLINKIVNNSIEYNIHEMREYVKNLLKTLPPTIRSYVINLSDKLGSENSDVYRDILKFYGGIFTFDNSSTSVYLFHKLKGLDHAKYSKRICIEDFICLNNLKDNENYKRYYIYFINELKEAITAEYINNIYSILKKFF